MKERLIMRKDLRFAAVILMLLLTCSLISSCTVIHQVISKKVEITFDANGGTMAGEDVKEEGQGAETYTAKCIVGDPIPDIKTKKKYYKFAGWFTDKDGGIEVETPSEDDSVLYAHYESANPNKDVKISGFTTNGKDTLVRISRKEEENNISVTFRLSAYFGQKVAFTDKKGKVLQEIDVESSAKAASQDGELFTSDGIDVTAEIPNRKWMDHKVAPYYIKSYGNDHVNEGDPVKFTIKLDGQGKYFDLPVEGSTVWYGGSGETPSSRAGVIVATDDTNVYAKNGDKVYKWAKADVMINLADVLTGPVYDIYNAYSSRFFPIKGKAMYMDNGGKGLKRYGKISKEKAMHKNRKTGKTTFMVPVQWDFASTIALAESRAKKQGYTLYIADTFRPMNSVDPVAKKVKDASLLTYGGSSAHNFGLAVDTGWQKIDKNGKPVGEPYVKNLQALNKKKAIQGPRGNARESWWKDVNKLPQEWWHYGDSILPSSYKGQAKRVGSLYVNLSDCPSMKRSKMSA